MKNALKREDVFDFNLLRKAQMFRGLNIFPMALFQKYYLSHIPLIRLELENFFE